MMGLRDLWRRRQCSHLATATHTFIENSGGGPMVKRQMVCLDCGKHLVPFPALDHKTLVELLERAKRLPRGSSLEIP
jgi:hypothetical protein